MTDFEALVDLLHRFGITPNIETVEDETHVVLEAQNGGVRGYIGFYCVFAFTQDGKFRAVAVWE